MFKLESFSKVIESPFFFPSISSIRTNFKIDEYLKLLMKIAYPGFLISAYDIDDYKDKEKLIKQLNEINQNSAFVLMDNGNYEAFWNQDNSWTFEKFEKILKNAQIDLCFSYDIFWNDKKITKHINETIKYTAMTGGVQHSGTTIPIIHGTPNNFPSLVKGVVEGINPEIIGITERELGDSLIQRTETLFKIRKELIKIKREIPIHLLGTGNPISILVYSLCGANFFDALEWCKNVVNPKTAHLYHFVQMELIECDCKVCNLKGLPYPVKVISHNLLFYEKFLEEIRISIKKGKSEQLLKKYLPKHIIPKIKPFIITK
ncbi:MAG: queuine tRNA-ribosyltransferase family protein [Nanoarchaeota archaeon]|nr:queuine tRNA-ribosyltransferase family protein [Nanoarchaeota archaeon]